MSTEMERSRAARAYLQPQGERRSREQEMKQKEAEMAAFMSIFHPTHKLTKELLKKPRRSAK